MSSPAPQIRYHRRRSLAGPIVLITIGVIFLLGNMHLIAWPSLRHYFALYWPVLLIVWGVVRLLEHWRDNREGVPARGIGAGGVLLIIFVVLFGMAFTASDRVNWSALRSDAEFDSDFAGLFGNSYTFNATLEQPFPAGTDLRIVSDRGDVVVNNWAEPKIKVVVRKKVVADNEQQGKKIDSETQPTFTTAGTMMTLNANTGGAGNRSVASDLEIYLPEKSNLDISTGHGDIRIAGHKGNVVTSSRGDVTIADNAGSVNISLRRGDVRAASIKGDVTIDGRADDVSLSDVTGQVRLNGDFFGQMTLAKIANGVTFHSSRTDLQMAKLDGEMVMDSGDFRASSVAGPMHLATRSKDIHLEDVSGNLKVDNSNGMVEYRAGKSLGDVEINNQRGTVQVLLPRNGTFQVDARANRGDIESDFPSIQVRSEHSAHYATGSVGTAGQSGPQIRLTNSYGDVQIRQSSSLSAPPLPPKAPTVQEGVVIRPGRIQVYRSPAMRVVNHVPGAL